MNFSNVRCSVQSHTGTGGYWSFCRPASRFVIFTASIISNGTHDSSIVMPSSRPERLCLAQRDHPPESALLLPLFYARGEVPEIMVSAHKVGGKKTQDHDFGRGIFHLCCSCAVLTFFKAHLGSMRFSDFDITGSQ